MLVTFFIGSGPIGEGSVPLLLLNYWFWCCFKSVLVHRRKLPGGGPSSGMPQSVFITLSLTASQMCGAMAWRHGKRSLSVPNLTMWESLICYFFMCILVSSWGSVLSPSSILLLKLGWNGCMIVHKTSGWIEWMIKSSMLNDGPVSNTGL